MTHPLPAQGSSPEQILAELNELKRNDIDWRDGKALAYVFHASEETEALAEEAFRQYMWQNALDPTVFPSTMKLETEIVAWAANHLRGDENVVGNFTSGGTESVLLAVKTARDHARVNRPQITTPNMVLPISAHPCFHKAAHYFGIETKVTPIDPNTCQADPSAIRESIDPNTILLVASAPSYANGAIDPVPTIGKIAAEKGLLFHVDGCIGGFLLPFFRELGADVPDFDFQVEGVTSMSMDFHKYAYCPKGASVVLHRNAEIRKHQIFSYSGWPGYTIINPTVQSSKSGGPLAACWAVLRHQGREGFLKIASELLRLSNRFRSGIEAHPELKLVGTPGMTLFAIATETIDVFALCDELKKRGWTTHPQMQIEELPSNFHINLIPLQKESVLDAFFSDLDASIEVIQGSTQEQGPMVAMVREALQGFDTSTVPDEVLMQLLQMVGLGEGGLPDSEMAEINHILDELPIGLRDRVLTLYFNELCQFHPQTA
ncbi:MAG: aspartate aminotransferase family protein [Planctomycetota bacterium]|jgi:glutamate/tyrosine decarboxylase-like PLP-dependent enzyme|nr:aspartate aminotransferase family protein [Planctomycetota bacterium]